ncbi:cobalamin-binding protein [Shewanella benthica]|uniref:ABC transporter, periplasmic substrate-binding protein, putative n=1 Tax=Shewanella benthica KT99 TaxID=314608 RepID=A9D395_9GAMM|nr:cobalamin-binding protein [Shewanella benthica]EDQ01637.1 ABC transporter, periplasmic substrate-binding protein, putative [Shewanella benthica KT99]
MKTIWIILLGLLSYSVVAKPQRLVALSPSSVEMLFVIGAGDGIIGTVAYADYPEVAKQIPRIGRHDFLDFEAMLLLNPDAVVLDSTSVSQLLTNRLQALGFKLIDTRVTELEQIPQRLLQLGSQTGHEEQASRVAREFSQTLAALKRQYQHLAVVDVFLQIWPEPLTTSASSWMNEIIQGCGGNNVFANSVNEYPQVSVEQVLARLPEVIIKPVHGDRSQADTKWQAWPEIPAVANHQIVNIDGDLIYRTGPRVLQGMTQICEIIDAARRQLQHD